MPHALEIISGGITAFIVLLGVASPIIIICLVYYFKKRLEHKQIMAAIEKGTPLSELRPVKKRSHPGPTWVRETTSGISMIAIAIGLTFLFLLMFNFGMPHNPFLILLLIPVVFFGNGLGALIRGRMLKKIPQERPPEQNTAECSQSVEKTPIEA